MPSTGRAAKELHSTRTKELMGKAPHVCQHHLSLRRLYGSDTGIAVTAKRMSRTATSPSTLSERRRIMCVGILVESRAKRRFSHSINQVMLHESSSTGSFISMRRQTPIEGLPGVPKRIRADACSRAVERPPELWSFQSDLGVQMLRNLGDELRHRLRSR